MQHSSDSSPGNSQVMYTTPKSKLCLCITAAVMIYAFQTLADEHCKQCIWIIKTGLKHFQWRAYSAARDVSATLTLLGCNKAADCCYGSCSDGEKRGGSAVANTDNKKGKKKDVPVCVVDNLGCPSIQADKVKGTDWLQESMEDSTCFDFPA